MSDGVTINDKNFTLGSNIIHFDSEDSTSFNWTFLFQNCVFKNLYGYGNLFYYDEIETIKQIFRNNTFENIVTYQAPIMVEASNWDIIDCTFRNMKTLGQGGSIFQKYGVDNLGEFNNYFFYYYGTNVFENNFAFQGGGAMALTYGIRSKTMNGTITFKNCRSSGTGGAILLLSWSVFWFGQTSSAKFLNCKAKIGGAVYLTDHSELGFDQIASIPNPTRNIFDSNSAIGSSDGNSGAAIFSQTSQLYLGDVTVKNHKDFVTIQIDRGKINRIMNVKFYDNYAPDAGTGVIDCQSCEYLDLTNVEAYNNHMLFGGVMSLGDIYQDVNIVNSKFYNNKATMSGGVIIGSSFYQNLNIINCEFSGNYAKSAGVLRLIEQSGNIKIKNSIFQNNGAETIGVMYSVLANSTLIEGSEFISNYAANDVGVLSLTNQNNTVIQNSTFYKNKASNKAVFQVDTKSNLTLSNCQFQGNVAQMSMSIGSVSDSNRLTIYKTTFKENLALNEGYGLNIMQTQNAKIDQCTFQSNFAAKGSSNLEVSYFSKVRIFKSTFQISLDESKLFNTMGKGHFIIVRSETDVQIRESKFSGGQATEGGAIYLEDGSTLLAVDCIFDKNSASVNGGVLYATYPDMVTILNSEFSMNKALGKGSHLYVSYVNYQTGQLNVQNCKFRQKSIQQNAIFIRRSPTYMKSIGLFAPTERSIDSVTQIQSNGQAIDCEECLKLVIEDSFVNNYISKFGGAISVVTPDLTRQSYPTQYLGLQLINTRFENNIATDQGGALYLENPVKGIIKDCKFSGNMANSMLANQYLPKSYMLQTSTQKFTGIGGAIYYMCDPMNNGTLDCDLQISQTSFLDNKAYEKGGAIHNYNIEPRIDRNSVYFSGNQAGQYGDLFSSEAHRLINIPEYMIDRVSELHFVDSQIINDQRNKLINFKQFQSGAKVQTMYFALIDLYGNLLTTDSKSMLFVDDQSDSKKLVSNGLLEYSNSISGTFYTALNGVFTVDSLVLVSTPKSNQSLRLITNDINFQHAYNSRVKNESLNSINITVQVRSCLPGEEISHKGECIECPPNSFLTDIPSKSSKCKSCPSEFAVCLGGNRVYPRPGFWRSSGTSEDFIQCRNIQACKGGIISGKGLEETLYFQTGKCDIGYQGVLCADCDITYQRTSNFKCGQCPDKTWNILRIVGIFFFIGIVIVFLVRSTINGAKVKGNYTSAFNKILINHMQVISIIGQFDLQWPEFVKRILQDSQVMQESQSMLVSFDCFLDKRTMKNPDANYVRISFQKVLIFILLPIVVTGLIGCLFAIAHKHYKRKAFNNRESSLTQQQKIQKQMKGDNENNINFESQSEFNQQDETLLIKGQTSINTRVFESEQSMIKNDATSNGPRDFSQKDNDIEVELEWLERRKKSTIIILLFFLYPTICQSVFSLFNCTLVDKQQRLFDDPEVVCYKGVHFFMVVGAGITGFIFWVVGIPLYGYLQMRQHSSKLDMIKIKEQLGFLYNGFRDSTYFWEIYIMYRKVLFVAVQVFLVSFGLKVQAYVILLLILVALQVNLNYRPYALHTLNQLETASLTACLITTYCGLFYLTASDKGLSGFFNARKDFLMNEGAIYFFFTVILVVNAGFFIFWGIQFFNELKKTLFIKQAWIYKLLCVCHKKDAERFEREKALVLMKQANEDEVSELEALIDSLTQAKEIYAGGHSLEKDKKFKTLFKRFKNELSQIDVGKIQSEKEVRLAMFQRKQQLTIKNKRAMLSGSIKNQEKKYGKILPHLQLENIDEEISQSQIAQNNEFEQSSMILAENRKNKKVSREIQQKDKKMNGSAKDQQHQRSVFGSGLSKLSLSKFGIGKDEISSQGYNKPLKSYTKSSMKTISVKPLSSLNNDCDLQVYLEKMMHEKSQDYVSQINRVPQKQLITSIETDIPLPTQNNQTLADMDRSIEQLIPQENFNQNISKKSMMQYQIQSESPNQHYTIMKKGLKQLPPGYLDEILKMDLKPREKEAVVPIDNNNMLSIELASIKNVSKDDLKYLQDQIIQEERGHNINIFSSENEKPQNVEDDERNEQRFFSEEEIKEPKSFRKTQTSRMRSNKFTAPLSPISLYSSHVDTQFKDVDYSNSSGFQNLKTANTHVKVTDPFIDYYAQNVKQKKKQQEFNTPLKRAGVDLSTNNFETIRHQGQHFYLHTKSINSTMNHQQISGGTSSKQESPRSGIDLNNLKKIKPNYESQNRSEKKRT